MKTKTIQILGFNIEVYRFGDRLYMYPSFNGNAEFKVNHKGFRELHHCLRNILWMQKQMKLIEQVINTSK